MPSQLGYNLKIPSNIQHRGRYIFPAYVTIAAMKNPILAQSFLESAPTNDPLQCMGPPSKTILEVGADFWPKL